MVCLISVNILKAMNIEGLGGFCYFKGRYKDFFAYCIRTEKTKLNICFKVVVTELLFCNWCFWALFISEKMFHLQKVAVQQLAATLAAIVLPWAQCLPPTWKDIPKLHIAKSQVKTLNVLLLKTQPLHLQR